MRLSAFFAAVVVSALIVGGYFYFRDTAPPLLALQPGSGPLSAKTSMSLELQDSGSGLKNLSITAIQGEKKVELLRRDFATPAKEQKEEFTLEKAGLREGPFELRVTAGDASYYKFGRGNGSEQTYAFTYDNRPPAIAIISNAHYLNQGGTGLIVYTLSEEVEKTGVQLGERFFPGFRQKAAWCAAFFALFYDTSPSAVTPRVVAVDPAGNERQVGFYYHANARSFPPVRMEISKTFLDNKMPEFQHFFPETTGNLEIFLRVNRELREANRAKLREIGRNTAPTPLWEGPFLRMPNAATRGFFAEQRTYFHEGRKIDEQTHLGIDLASLSQAPIPAANHGKVIFADDLGIYGQTVIIDHGVGVQSLYAHLSHIAVEVDQNVTKGQIIGRTGLTGLAGGDHLHFDMLVHGLPVTPLEWWDPTWLRNNILSKLELIGG